MAFEPDIHDVSLGSLSREMFKTILQRTIDYGFTDFFHDAREEFWDISREFDYKVVLTRLVKRLHADMWFMMASDNGEGQLPSFAFQKDEVNVMICGGRAGQDHGVHVTVTGQSKAQLRALVAEMKARLDRARTP